MSSVIEDLPFEQYIAMPCTHATALKDMLVSPLLYRWRRDHERPDTDAFRVGRAVHTAILQPERFLADYALWEGGIRRGKEWDAFEASAAEKGRTVLKREQYETALAIQKSAHRHQPSRRYVLDPDRRTEVSLRWTHKRTGIEIKARVDLLAGGAMTDIKSTRDPSPRKFASDAARLGYAMQLALYRDGCLEVLGEALPVKIAAVQNLPPYDVALYDVPRETLLAGSEQVERALDLLAECTASGKWPGIAPSEELSLVLPAWASAEQDDEPLTFDGVAL